MDSGPESLRIEIADSGSGGEWKPGVGITSMRERAEQIGGRLTVRPGPGGGRVTAVLPILREEEPPPSA